MQLIPQLPAKTLQLAHLRQNLIRKDVDVFKANLSTLLQRVEIAENNNEHEDNFKILVLDFLKETYYKGVNEINTNVRYDLVIHKEKTANSPVSVIFEVKRPSNNAEMISERTPNTKALQELLHYFLQESFIKGNKQIKHLIITNIYEWYIFDAAIFEKIFFENKKFIQQYKDWNEKKLGIYKTDWLYQELLKPFIENELGEVSCAYFNLKDYKEVVQKTDEEEDKKLISLYKIFSPAHLLKHSFVNDANTLNKEFYFELLHILGLEEVKDGGQKIIRKNSNAEKFEGSLLDNIINKLSLGNKFKDISKSQNIDNQEYEKYVFDIAMELCINWLNRILFLKLLEGQLIKYHKGNRNYAFLNIHFIKDFDELEELFFEVLAIPVKDRKASVTKKFGNIPYLNSSLFEYSDLEKQYISIGCLKDRLEMPIYRATVLKDGAGNRLNGTKNTLEYLFQFLNSFNFGSESNEDIQQENKTIINAAVLGLIFEKINGYQDGSFFTPSFITTYMCRQTIRKTIIQKFNEKYNWNCTDFENLKDRIDIYDTKLRKEANEIVNSIKICDPAVGSGHFLVSALNELIAVKNDLQILCYRNGDRIKEYEITVENDEISIIDKETRNLFEYRLNQVNTGIDDLQKLQEAFFHEKQKMIENCLFGVDINPKSVAICRLRLWIELLKNMYYTKESKFTELETLPNIDINIKCGNSLVSRFGLGNVQNLLPKDRIFVKNLIDKYKIQVVAYKSVKDLGAKDNIREQIRLLKMELEKFVVPNDKDFETLRKKEAELGQISFAFDAKEREKQVKLAEEVTFLRQKYTQKLQTLYRNSFEWRFDFPEVLDENGDFVGFDVVVANPPYGINLLRNYADIFENNYKTFYGRGESYVLFIEMANNILKNKGLLAYIIPDTLLNLSFTELSREYILKNTYLSEVDLLPTNVFANASVDTILLFFQKTESIDTFHESDVSVKIYTRKEKLVNLDFPQHSFSISTAIWHQQGAFNLQISQKDYNILYQIEQKFPILAFFAEIFSGVKAYEVGKGIPAQTVDIKNNKPYTSAQQKDKHWSPFLDGKHIGRYETLWKEDNWILYGNHLAASRDAAHFEGEKILIRKIISERLIAHYVSDTYFCNTLLFILKLIPEKANIPYLSLLGILNSRFIAWYFRKKFQIKAEDIFPQIMIKDILLFPIPNLNNEITKGIEILVSEVINSKKQGINPMDLESQIDALVYKLYHLTEEEIAIIEEKYA